MNPLDGIKVTDITTMLNGPFTAMLLSDMGADVIKVEPPDGDPWRMVAGGFMACNRGKRAIAVDMKKEEGKKIVYDLIARSDILVENARWGVWHKIGLDYESIIKIKPDIIYVSALGHGSKGPYSSTPGYDPLLQSRSGQSVGQGGIGKPPVFFKIPINDQASPILAAYGAVLALLSRLKRGKGQRVETSLTNASIAMQSGEFIDYKGIDRKYLGDTGILGLNATHRHYQAGDGRWIFILCPKEEHWRSLCELMGLEELIEDPRFKSHEKRRENDHALLKILEDVFKKKPSSYWLSILPQADLPVSLGHTIEEVMKDPHCIENGLFIEIDHPQFGRVKQVGVIPRFSRTKGIIRRPAPLLGEHTEEILREIGYSEDKIAQLKEKRIVIQASIPS
jgi:crotonobetainyl-CoA:carnitine CoA-transferase CaiB-like acyl-CoA transferase